MSQLAPRAVARWSTPDTSAPAHVAGSPAPSAALVGRGWIVSVGPPWLPSVPSSPCVPMPARSPLRLSVIVVQPAVSPRMLWPPGPSAMLAEQSLLGTGLATLPVPVFPAMIVLLATTGEVPLGVA